MTPQPEGDPPPAAGPNVSAAHGGGRASGVAVSVWFATLTQESVLFGAVLVAAGLLLDIPCNSFIRGVAGNVFAAGIVVLLFALCRWGMLRIQASNARTAVWLARCLRWRKG